MSVSSVTREAPREIIAQAVSGDAFLLERVAIPHGYGLVLERLAATVIPNGVPASSCLRVAPPDRALVIA